MYIVEMNLVKNYLRLLTYKKMHGFNDRSISSYNDEVLVLR